MPVLTSEQGEREEVYARFDLRTGRKKEGICPFRPQNREKKGGNMPVLTSEQGERMMRRVVPFLSGSLG